MAISIKRNIEPKTINKPKDYIPESTRLPVTSSKSKYYPKVGCIKLIGLHKESKTQKIYIGTGTLIAPNLVLTCAHNTDAKGNQNIQVEHLIFSPGITYDQSSPEGEIKVAKVVAHPEYKIKDGTVEPGSDVAILVLEKNVSTESGCISYTSLSDKELSGLWVTITGYPGESQERQRILKESRKEKEMQNIKQEFIPLMVRNSGKIYKLSSSIVSYKIRVSEGQSGSAIVRFSPTLQYELIGIHTQGSQEKTNGSGVRITPKLENWIDLVKKEHETKYFIPPLFISEREIISNKIESLNNSLKIKFPIRSDLEPMYMIGSGFQGTVDRVYDPINFKTYARKTVIFEDFESEVQSLQELKILIFLIENFLDPRYIAFSYRKKKKRFPLIEIYRLEYKPGKYFRALMEYGIGTMNTYFNYKKNANSKISREEGLIITQQLKMQTDFLRELKIYHRDIKPANIIITENMTIKLTDFGISEFLDGNKKEEGIYKVCGTRYFCSNVIEAAFENENEKLQDIKINLWDAEKETILNTVNFLLDEEEKKIEMGDLPQDQIGLISDPYELIPINKNHNEKITEEMQKFEIFNHLEKDIDEFSLIKLLRYLLISNPRECQNWIEDVHKLDKFKSSTDLKISLLVINGDLEFSKKNFEKSLGFYEEAHKIYVEEYLGENSIEILQKMANSLYKLKKYEESERIVNNCLKSTNPKIWDDVSQTCNLLEFKSKILFKLENYKEALSHIDQSKELIIESSGEKSKLFCNLLELYGRYYAKLEKKESRGKKSDEKSKSEEFFLRSIELRESLLGFDSLEYADSLEKIGMAFLKLSNAEKSIQMLSKCFEVRKSILGEIHKQVASTYDKMAEVMIFVKEFGHAEALLQKSLEIKEKIYEEDSEIIIDAIYKLAEVIQIYDPKTSTDKFTDIFERKKKLLGSQHRDIAIINEKIGDIFDRLQKRLSTNLYYREALKIFNINIGFYAKESQGILNKIIEVNLKENEYDDLYKICGEFIPNPTNDAESEFIIELLDRIRKHSYEKGKFLQSWKFCEKIMNITVNNLSFNENLIRLYLGKIAHQDFENCIEKNFKLASSLFEKDEKRILDYYEYYAHFFISQRNLEKGSSFLKLVEDKLLKSNEYSVLSQFLEKFTDILTEFEYYDEALDYMRKITELKNENNCSNEDYQFYEKLALIFDKKKEFQESLKNFEKIIELKSKKFGEKNIELISTFYSKAEICEKLNHYDNAIVLYEKCLQILLEQTNQDKHKIADVYEKKGSLLLQLSKAQETQKYFSLSLDFRKKIVPSDKIETARSLFLLGEAYKHQKNLSEAYECYYSAYYEVQNLLNISHVYAERIGDLFLYDEQNLKSKRNKKSPFEFYQISLNSKQELFGDKSKEVYEMLVKIGDLYLKDEISESKIFALENYEKALAKIEISENSDIETLEFKLKVLFKAIQLEGHFENKSALLEKIPDVVMILNSGKISIKKRVDHAYDLINLVWNIEDLDIVNFIEKIEFSTKGEPENTNILFKINQHLAQLYLKAENADKASIYDSKNIYYAKKNKIDLKYPEFLLSIAKSYIENNFGEHGFQIFITNIDLKLGYTKGDLIINLLNLGNLTMDSENSTSAWLFFNEAITLLDDSVESKDIILAELVKVAEAYIKVNKLDRAEELYRKCIEIKQKYSLNMEEVLEKLAKSCHQQELNDKILIANTEFSDFDVELIQIHTLSSDEALLFLQNQLDNMTADDKTSNAKRIRINVLLSEIMKKKLEIEKSLEYLENALSLQMDCIEGKVTDTANIYVKIAELHKSNLNFQEALEFFDIALDILECSGEENEEIAKIYESKGIIRYISDCEYKKENKNKPDIHDELYPGYQKPRENFSNLDESEISSDSDSDLSSELNLDSGSDSDSDNEYGAKKSHVLADSRDFLEKSIQVRSKINGQADEKAIPALEILAKIYISQNKKSRAQNNYSKIFEILKRKDAYSKESAHYYFKAGQNCIKKFPEFAKSCFDISITLKKRLLNKNEIGFDLLEIADICLKNKKFDWAYSCYICILRLYLDKMNLEKSYCFKKFHEIALEFIKSKQYGHSFDIHKILLNKMMSFFAADIEQAEKYEFVSEAYYSNNQFKIHAHFRNESEKLRLNMQPQDLDGLLAFYGRTAANIEFLKNFDKCLNLISNPDGISQDEKLKVYKMFKNLYILEPNNDKMNYYFDKYFKILELDYSIPKLTRLKLYEEIYRKFLRANDLKLNLIKNYIINLAINIYGEYNEEYACYMENLALICCETSRLDCAIEFFDKSLRIIVSIYGEKSLQVAQNLVKFSTTCHTNKENQESVKYLDKADRIAYEIFSEDKTKLLNWHNTNLLNFLRESMFELAWISANKYIDFIDLQQELNQENDKDKTYIDLSLIFLKHKSFDKSLELMQTWMGTKNRKDFSIVVENILAYLTELVTNRTYKAYHLETVLVFLVNRIELEVDPSSKESIYYWDLISRVLKESMYDFWREVLEKLLNSAKKVYGVQSIEVFELLENVDRYICEYRREKIEYLQQALRIAISRKDENLMIRAYEKLSSAASEINDFKLSFKYVVDVINLSKTKSFEEKEMRSYLFKFLEIFPGKTRYDLLCGFKSLLNFASMDLKEIEFLERIIDKIVEEFPSDLVLHMLSKEYLENLLKKCLEIKKKHRSCISIEIAQTYYEISKLFLNTEKLPKSKVFAKKVLEIISDLQHPLDEKIINLRESAEKLLSSVKCKLYYFTEESNHKIQNSMYDFVQYNTSNRYQGNFYGLNQNVNFYSLNQNIINGEMYQYEQSLFGLNQNINPGMIHELPPELYEIHQQINLSRMNHNQGNIYDPNYYTNQGIIEKIFGDLYGSNQQNSDDDNMSDL